MRAKHILLPLALAMGACSRSEHKPEALDRSAELQEKLDTYCTLAANKIKERGFAVSKCDGLLFSALHAVSCGYPNVLPFEDAGRWYRDPAHECGATSGSTISKDMIAGLMLWASVRSARDVMKRFIDYGNANNWKLGTAFENEIGTVVLSPSGIALAHDVYNYTKNDSTRTSVDGPYVARQGYEAHLAVVGQVTKHVINRGLSDAGLSLIQKEASREPRNAFYQAMLARYGGDKSKCIDLLLDESKFPKASLPNSRDNYCTEYLYQRDDDSNGRADGKIPDWLPCPEQPVKEYDGTDFVFAASLCGGEP